MRNKKKRLLLSIVISGCVGVLCFAFAWAAARDCDTGSVSPQFVYVRGGHPACISESYMRKRIGANLEEAAALHKKGFCFPLPDGETAFLEESTPDGLVKIRLAAHSDDIWTNGPGVSFKPIAGGMSDIPSVGLGDTLEAIDKAWNKGYREVRPQFGGVNLVSVGTSEESAIQYYTGLNDFGDPKRAGQIGGGAKGLFGARAGEQATRAQFFSAITHLMPKGSKLICAYQRADQSEEVYMFESEWLKTLPGIGAHMAYQDNQFRKANPLGAYSLDVYYDSRNPDRVTLFKLVLGYFQQDDLVGMTRISNPKFRLTD
ncbi:MAG: hypothetical protein ACLP51_08900 [Syntrophobacteraceae bacterium]